jgi:hypothetical protein
MVPEYFEVRHCLNLTQVERVAISGYPLDERALRPEMEARSSDRPEAVSQPPGFRRAL